MKYIKLYSASDVFHDNEKNVDVPYSYFYIIDSYGQKYRLKSADLKKSPILKFILPCLDYSDGFAYIYLDIITDPDKPYSSFVFSVSINGNLVTLPRFALVSSDRGFDFEMIFKSSERYETIG